MTINYDNIGLRSRPNFLLVQPVMQSVSLAGMYAFVSLQALIK
ncbi:hypothetical protein [Chlorogloea sp. CCALA 695]|nr:hypothetical protein [Chlorogloea sp. CCALA 695]